MYLTNYFYFFVFIICTTATVVSSSGQIDPLSDDFIELINKERKWVAGRNFHPDTPIEYLKDLLGENDIHPKYSHYKNIPVIEHDSEVKEKLPEYFDPRDKWPNCPSLNEIRDQGRCGACWAFAAVEAMTDRVCIHSNGTKNFHFSAEDLVQCSTSNNGCHGGQSSSVWLEWMKVGLVSGGNYNSHQGCKPYSIPTCLHHLLNCTNYLPTPSCHYSCEEGYNVSYKADRKRGKSVYYIDGVDNIMTELFINGPASAIFLVYQDFAHYKSGVYQHLKGEILGGHAVKLMGWGTENGTDYWLVANSWNTDFGENGYFKILRGVNECFIERAVMAGIPYIDYD